VTSRAGEHDLAQPVAHGRNVPRRIAATGGRRATGWVACGPTEGGHDGDDVHDDGAHTGLSFGEAPRWHDGRLWFSDFFRHGVFSLGDEGERLEVAVPTQPSGLGWRADGTLLIVSMTTRCSARSARTAWPARSRTVSEHCGYWANDMVVAKAAPPTSRTSASTSTRGSSSSPTRPRRGAAPLAQDDRVIVVDPDGSILQIAGDSSSRTGWC